MAQRQYAWTFAASVALCLAFPGSFARADVLSVRRGGGTGPGTPDTPRTNMRCVIVEETPTAFRVLRSQGTITFPKRRVLAVEYESDDVNAALRERWAGVRRQNRESAGRIRAARRVWERSPAGQAERRASEQAEARQQADWTRRTMARQVVEDRQRITAHRRSASTRAVSRTRPPRAVARTRARRSAPA